MKKSFFKYALICSLVAMPLAFASCGDKDDDNNSGNNNNPTDTTGGNDNPSDPTDPTGNETWDVPTPAYNTEGALRGVFSVGENATVYFAKGNLQYNDSLGSWRLAENQYDYIGTNNNKIGDTAYGGWIDLFGWGTSQWHNADDANNKNYSPISYSNAEVDATYNYYGYGPSANVGAPDLAGRSKRYDWGVNLAIPGAGNASGNWRTLTKEEWEYLLNERAASTVNNVENARFAKGKVGGIFGLIVFPDNYNHPADVTAPRNINGVRSNYDGNTYDVENWEKMEAAGAVFLPAAGKRSARTTRSFGENANYANGNYWSTTHCEDLTVAPGATTHAYALVFSYERLDASTAEPRYNGRSVRLVKDVQ